MMVSFISRIVNSSPQKYPTTSAGLCRAEGRSDTLSMGKSHPARHNPVPGIIPIMPGAA